MNRLSVIYYCILSGTNAQLTYDILSSNISNFDSLLTIGPTDGVIRKRGSASFDREVTGNIYLTIVAYDNGTHQRNGTTEVLIKLLVCAINYSL